MATGPEIEFEANGLPRHWLEAETAPAPAPGLRERLRLELGRDAAESLMSVASEDLLRVMLRRSFRPIEDLDVVPVAPCPYCLDGGLRLAGTVRGEDGRLQVRGCDTCGAVEVGGTRMAGGTRQAQGDRGRAPAAE